MGREDDYRASLSADANFAINATSTFGEYDGYLHSPEGDERTRLFIESRSEERAEEREHEEKIRELKTPRRTLLDFANVLKSFIGSNFLGMPYAFSLTGVYLGFIALFVIAFVTDHCCTLLVECKNTFADKKDIKTYGDVGYRVFGRPGRVIVDIFLVFTQLFFCVGYMVFIAANLTKLLGWPVGYILLLECVLVLPFVFIKDVKHFGIPSIGADICLLVGIIAVFSLDNLASKADYVGFDLKGLPLFFGMVTGALEGIGLVLPVEETMTALPRRYPMMLHITLVIVACILSSFGTMGYLTYGSATCQIITLNLPSGSHIGTAITVCLVIAIVLTYPMQLFPVAEVIEKILWERTPAKIDEKSFVREMPSKTPSYFDVKRNGVRIFLVVVTCIIGWAVPYFALISGLTGALGSSSLAYLLPVLFHLKLLHKDLHWTIKMKDVLILVFGAVALVYSTYLAIRNIVDALDHSNSGPAHC
eukprot:TRINITY_DN2230_c0_g1_i1.p1 TRINITY_DN2230_c0_g1~~TRINITY_DN2230_c0_g1_i1.p1  ORF type:complete len:491 (-),score=89.25 TRINITY_DN2230_c0_g1_i1:224-1654(-)